jgi:hypothetical protein
VGETSKGAGPTKVVAKIEATYPLTLVSSTAKVFMAACMRSKLVLFQTKSTLKLWFTSMGTPCHTPKRDNHQHVLSSDTCLVLNTTNQAPLTTELFVMFYTVFFHGTLDIDVQGRLKRNK